MNQEEYNLDSLWRVTYTSSGQIDFTNYSQLISSSAVQKVDNYDSLVIEILTFLHSSWNIPIIISLVYLASAFGLQHFMRHRKPIELKAPLIFWNLTVSIFSTLGFIFSSTELIKFIGKSDGFYESICIPKYGRNYIYAAVLFALSKIPELVDTLFVVLRKKPLEPAQWYHHVITVIGMWICSPYAEPVARYMVVINYGVHSVMYLYFALKVAKVQVPSGIAKTITTLQFAQMVFILFCNGVSAYYYLSGSRYCHRHPVSLIFICVVNITFLVIFGRLFNKLVIQKTISLRAVHEVTNKIKQA